MKSINDNVIVLTVIWFLGVGFVGGLFGLFAISWRGLSLPEGMATIVSTMGGALAAILTTTRAQRQGDSTGVGRPGAAGAPADTSRLEAAE